MRHRWIVVVVFLIIALGLAFIFKREMEKMNGGTVQTTTSSSDGFSQKVENALGDLGEKVLDVLS